MPKFDLDLTSAGLVPEGRHIAVVQKLQYQVKVGEKWNQEGTLDVDYEAFKSYSEDDKRLHFTLQIPDVGVMFHTLYFKPTALGFMKTFLLAAGVNISEGFDPEDALGSFVTLVVIHKDEGEYGLKAIITKVLKA